MTLAGVRTTSRRCGFTAARRGGVIKHLLFPLAVAAAGLTLLWMLALPGLFAQRLEQTTGFTLTSGRLMANPLSGHIRLTDAAFANPAGYPKAPFLSVNLLETTVRPWVVSERPLPLPRVTLDIDALVVVIGPDGQRNTSQLDAALAGLGRSGQSPFRISRLELTVSRVTVADYSHGSSPRLAEFQTDYRRTFTDVTRLEPVLNDVLTSVRR